MNTATAARRGEIVSMLLARWPSVVGLALLTATSIDGPDPHVTSMIVILAAMCYLAAAALGSRRSAWVMIGVATVAVTVAMFTALDATLLLLAGGVAFGVLGLVRGARIDRRELGIQAAGFVGFSLLALSAMTVGPVLAAHLAALAAIGHAGWDVVHHRRDKAVTRSFTEFCAVLDFGLGGVLLAVTWVGLLT